MKILWTVEKEKHRAKSFIEIIPFDERFLMYDQLLLRDKFSKRDFLKAKIVHFQKIKRSDISNGLSQLNNNCSTLEQYLIDDSNFPIDGNDIMLVLYLTTVWKYTFYDDDRPITPLSYEKLDKLRYCVRRHPVGFVIFDRKTRSNVGRAVSDYDLIQTIYKSMFYAFKL